MKKSELTGARPRKVHIQGELVSLEKVLDIEFKMKKYELTRAHLGGVVISRASPDVSLSDEPNHKLLKKTVKQRDS